MWIVVTAQDIADGIRFDSAMHPIAIASRRKLGDDALLDTHFIELPFRREVTAVTSIPLPELAYRWGLKFDRGQPVQPLRIWIEVA